MIELQHDHEYLPALLEVMGAVASSHGPRAAAQQALECMLRRDLIEGGAVWVRAGGELVSIAQSDLVASDLEIMIARVIEADAPAFLTLEPGQSPPHLAILPLQSAGARIGALAVATHKSPTPSLQLVLQAIAVHLGLAFDRGRLRQGDMAAATNREWEEFLSHAAHEIKNPLASIKGYADLLLRRAAKDASDPTSKGLTTISQQVGRTTALLEQLADISRIGVDRMPIDRHDANLAAIVESAVQECQASTSQHQLISNHAGQELRGRFDPFRIGQVIGTMLSNAIKFAPDGGPIDIKLWQSTRGGAPEAIVSVHDFGVGVPVGEQERVFDRFFRGSNIRGSFAGLGVGLYIGRAIVGLHGGRMWLESQRELGTTCFMALPLA